MKKLIALILSAVLISGMLSGCGTREKHTAQPDLTYWEKNISEAEAMFYIGNTAQQTDDFDSEKVLELIKSLELYPTDPLPQYNAINLGSYGLLLLNSAGDEFLLVRFYNDFMYASVQTGSEADVQYYNLNDNPRLREYFEAQDFYVDTETRSKVVNFVARALQSETPSQIAEYASSADRTRPLPVIPQDLALEEIGEISVRGRDGTYYGVEKFYLAHASAAYKDSSGNEHKYVYIFIVAEDERNEIYSLQTNMTQAESLSTMLAAGEFYPDAQIAGFSYAQWLHRLDNPYYNGFYYATGKGNSQGWTNGITECAAVVSCIENLQLGEPADVDFKSYDRDLIYTVSLFEDNQYFNEGELSLHFVEDFRYVKICDCENGSSICKNEHPVYEVKNPDTVIPLFENNHNHSYVSVEDYNEVVKYARKYMSETPVEKLKEISGTELVFPEGVAFSGQPAFISVDQSYGYPDKEGDFYIYFTAMFKYPGEERYLSYKVAMAVKKTLFGWRTTDIHISM